MRQGASEHRGFFRSPRPTGLTSCSMGVHTKSRQVARQPRAFSSKSEAEADIMKKKLTPAKMPLPKFTSDKEAAEYFEKHSVASVWDQLPEARPAVRAASKTSKKSLSSDEIAAKASRGEDISAHFTNKFTVVRPVPRAKRKAS